MSINGGLQAPKLLTTDRELGIFIPSVTFGYLYLLTGSDFMLGITVYQMVVNSSLYVTEYYFSKIDDEEIEDVQEDVGYLNIYRILGTLSPVTWLISLPLGSILLIWYRDVSPGQVTTAEISFLILLFINVTYTTGILLDIFQGLRIYDALKFKL